MTAPSAVSESIGMSRKKEMYGEAGVSPTLLGKFSARMPNGTATITWPTILRQPDRPRLRCWRTFM